MLILTQIFAYILIFLLGYMSLRLIMQRSHAPVFFRGEFFTIAFLLGIIELGFLLFLLGVFHVSLSLIPVMSVFVPILIILAYFTYRQKTPILYRETP